VLWQVYPRQTDVAKLDLLPRASRELPSSVQQTVKAAIDKIVRPDRERIVPSIPLFALEEPRVMQAVQEELVRLVEQRRV